MTTERKDKITYDFLRNKIFINKKLIYKTNTSSIENFFTSRNDNKQKKQIESLIFHKRIFQFKKKMLEELA